MADEVYADLLDSLSPLSARGLDPDEAAADRAGTMAKLLGPTDSPKANWYDPPAEEAQNNPPPRPGISQNGNPLPPGLQVRQPGVPTPDSPPIGSGAPSASSTDGTLFGSPNELQPKAAVPTGATPGGVSPSGSPKPADMTGASAASTALGQSYGRKLLQPADGGQVTAAPDDPTTASPSWADLQRRNVMSGLTNLDKSDQNLQTMQAQPDLATATAPLEQQRVNAQTRQVELQNPYDSNGKLLPEYKPSFGQRLMRGVAGFARGGVIGAVDPAIAGVGDYGAPNKELAIDQTQAAGRVAGADQQLKNASDNWKAASDRAKAQAVEQRANATSRGQLSTEITNQEKVPIDQQNADSETAKAYNESPQGKAEGEKELNATVLSDRMAQINDPKNPISKTSAADKAYFAGTGKMPDPDRYHAPVEQLLFERAQKAWASDPQNKGKTATLDDIQKMVQATKGTDPEARTRDANTEKEYMAAQKDLGSQFAGAQTQSEALKTAQDELASGAVGQAIGTVKTMVGLAGGKGTGVRITQAELNAIAKARGIEGSFEGYINGLEGKGSLSAQQLSELQGLLGDVDAKVQEKMKLQDSYLDKLSAAKSVDDIRNVQSQYRKEFTGGGSSRTANTFNWGDHPTVNP